MRLRSSAASPYGRKAKIAAKILGIYKDLTIEATETVKPDAAFLAENPLGKIPVLILQDGTTIFDSPVILEYLDAHAGGGRILPASGKARFDALTLQALADGLLDAALLIVYEGRLRQAEHRDEGWVARQQEKMARALAYLEANRPALEADVGTITLAAALGYLDLRFEGAWRKVYPGLVGWLEGFAAKYPAFDETIPQL